MEIFLKKGKIIVQNKRQLTNNSGSEYINKHYSIPGNWKNKQLIMDKLFFDSWDGLLRAFIATVLAYITLLVMIRISGKRTLSKMNAYDFIVTIALGSCLATTALNKSIPLAEGALVYFTLIGLQLTITWSAVRSSKIKRFVSGSPTLLLYKGKFLNHAMRTQRITIEEVYVVARKQGIEELKNVDVIILETTGDITIIQHIQNQHPLTLENIKLPKW
ncbi:MAG: YetF domain-containing protein [Ginsengibacter sp.]